MRILVFGGTTEGRELCARLASMSVDTTVCVATGLGAEELEGIGGLNVLVGRKDASRISELAAGYDLCVDATHPYAAEATRNISAGCEAAGVPLLRLLRSETESEGVTRVGSCAEAAELLKNRPGNILLTVGTKALPDFAPVERQRLFARVLPTCESISACENEGIPHRNIIAMQGPFSKAVNTALMEQYGISYMVTKDTGKSGGFPEKLEAARSAGVEVVLVSRPEDSGYDMETVLSKIREMIK